MHSFLEQLSYFNPVNQRYRTTEDVPDYIRDAWPLFVVAVVLEFCAAFYKGLPTLRIDDGFSTISCVILYQISRILLFGSELTAYSWIYENWRLLSLPWDSMWTWCLCFLCVDLGYYFFHRASHEVNILWAEHQIHHSSEDFNLTTGFRHGILKNLVSWIFYIPLALAIPPSVFLVHLQISLIYMFWIHTQVIESLGVLEYIFNTPSHHRVHHARNAYCIDKNYGNILIIWDMIFGTFQRETDETPVFGLVFRTEFWDPIWAQVHHYVEIIKRAIEQDGFQNKICVFIMGPSWTPGVGRLGNHPYDVPEIEYPVVKYGKQLSLWLNIYAVVHILVILWKFVEFYDNNQRYSQVEICTEVILFVISLSSLGALLDQRWYAPWLECVRCIGCAAFYSYLKPSKACIMALKN